MGKKEKVTIAKPPSDYFAGVSLDVKNVASVTANLSSVEVPILIKCASSLYAYILKDRDNNALLVHAEGGLIRLADLICHADVEVRRFSLMTVALCAHLAPVTHALVRRDKLIGRLIWLLQTEDKITIEFAMQIIAALSRLTVVKDQLAEEGLDHLVPLFSHQDPDIRLHTLSTLINLAGDFSLIDLVADYGEEIVAFCLSNLSSTFAIIQQKSLQLLYLLCHECYPQFADAGGIEKLLVFLMNPQFVELHVDALKLLKHVWQADFTAFVDNGSMENVVGVVAAGIDSAQGEAIAAQLCELIGATPAALPTDRGLLVSLANLCFKLIGSNNDQSKAAALEATRALSRQAEFVSIANQNGLIAKVVALFSSNEENLRRLVVLAVAEAVRVHSASRVTVLNHANLIRDLIPLLNGQDHDQAVGVVCLLISLGVDDEPFRAELVELDLLGQLSCAHQSELYLARLLDLVDIYVPTVDQCRPIVDSGLLASIVELVESPHLTVRTRAARLVGRLCQTEKMFEFFVAQGAVEKLARATESTHLDTDTARDALRRLLDFDLSQKMARGNCLTAQEHAG